MIQLLFYGAWMTLKVSSLAILIGLLLGTLFAVLSSRLLQRVWVRRLIGCYITLIRGTPLFVQLLIVYFAVPQLLGLNLSPFIAGVIALGMNSTAYVCETIRAGLDGLPQGQYEAAIALGYSRVAAMKSILLPQALRKVLPALTNEILTLIKESSILMVIGVPEITKTAKEIVARELNPMEVYLVAAGFYLGITGIVGWMLKRMERMYHVTD